MEQDLQAIMEQMVLALDQAIADAQTAEDISYSAFDGELLSQSGDHYTYQFKLRTQWEPEENSRVYVEIDKQAEQKLAARVVSLVRTTLMLSTTAAFLIGANKTLKQGLEPKQVCSLHMSSQQE